MTTDVRALSKCSLGNINVGRVEQYDSYEGPYTISPASIRQVFNTANKKMKYNIAIMPAEPSGFDVATVAETKMYLGID